MKRVLFVLVAALCVNGAANAQQLDKAAQKALQKATKEAMLVVKDAKEQLGDGGEVRRAKSLIEQALSNEYSKNNAETWNVAGDVYQKLYLTENYKTTMNQPCDTVAMYDYLVKMYDCYNHCDSLQQIPDAKGKTYTTCRDKNGAYLDNNRTNLINGGIFYFNRRRDYAKAFEIFSKYYEVSEMPMLKKYTEQDENYQMYAKQFAYYPTLAAVQMEDYNKVLKFVDLGIEDEENGETCYQFKCMAYENLGDTAKWIDCLKEGITRYPTKDFYYLRLLGYYDSNDNMAAMESFVNEMLEVAPEKAYNHYVKGYIRQNQKNYVDAIEAYKVAIEKDPNLQEAYINMGLCYIFEANNYMESQSDVKFNSPAYKKVLDTEKTYYQEALPIFEKVREMAPDEVKKWGLQLYSIYYKLNMSSELNKIETVLKAEGMLD
ncbi:MAG: hypothetical protein MJY65_02595 [Bacteroidaceae bacterium]|nr:hypothetical protein [Bacteroidaceae bacterium]